MLVTTDVETGRSGFRSRRGGDAMRGEASCPRGIAQWGLAHMADPILRLCRPRRRPWLPARGRSDPSRRSRCGLVSVFVRRQNVSRTIRLPPPRFKSGMSGRRTSDLATVPTGSSKSRCRGPSTFVLAVQDIPPSTIDGRTGDRRTAWEQARGKASRSRGLERRRRPFMMLV
jgi:hypothetical protein